MKRTSNILFFLLFLLLPFSARADHSAEQWRRLSPEERAIIQRNYQRWKALPSYEKQHLKNKWRHWRSLPPERQEELRGRYQKFRQLPSEERQHWRKEFRGRREFSPEQRRDFRERLQREKRHPGRGQSRAKGRWK